MEKIVIGIIGAGNMGGAVAMGLAARTDAFRIIVSDRSNEKLAELHSQYPAIETTADNLIVASNADILITAVKPWLVEPVLTEVRQVAKARILVSIAAGITLEQVDSYYAHRDMSIFRVMPNTAIALGKSMTLIAHNAQATADAVSRVKAIFDLLGRADIIEERLMGAGMALCSCGIAYVMRYVRAATEGAVELGLYPDQAKDFMLQTMEGAIAVLRQSQCNPESEIDRVTTPGGTTIRGLNAMEREGFTNSVIAGLLASGR